MFGANRDKGSNDFWIEMRTRRSNQFIPCIRHLHWHFVRSRGCHYLERIGNGNNSAPKADLLTSQAKRVPFSVEALMMFLRCK
jgi:hypothetical protein